MVVVVEGASATTISGGGGKRSDCLLQLQADGVGFPAGASRFKGTTCADGDVCDADGARNGSCRFLTIWCVAQDDPELANCGPAEVTAVKVSGRLGKGKANRLDSSPIDAALGAILPASTPACSAPVPLDVAVVGPDGKGRFKPGKAKLKARASTSRGRDKDRFQLVCLPDVSVPPSTTSTSVTTSTTIMGGSTTTTSLPVVGMPGDGLRAEFVDATVDPDGTVHASFTLTDDAGVPLTPSAGATSDSRMARVRITIARLETVVDSAEGVDAQFMRYVNYITNDSGQPTYDSGGSFELAEAATGTWRYTFGTMLPAGFPAGITHTVGAQVERETDAGTLVANPIFDFVPAGGPVMIRQSSTTQQCNTCHNPLALHGGGRRELRLCQLCHTNQAVDPDTGNTLDLAHMVHRIHRGKDLPSVVNGPVGTRYAIIGFQGSVHTYGEKVLVCEGGPFASAPCEVDADCDGGTCTGEAAVGVGFPRPVRECSVCHSDGATAENHADKPSTLSCTGCHDDVNPSEMPTEAGPPGTGHLAGDQPEALCQICHTGTADAEFDISVPGAHVVPEQSDQLAGLMGELLSASGSPGAPITIEFRLSDENGVITSLADFNRVAMNASGPTTDLGGAAVPFLSGTIAGGGANGTLMGPDAAGVFTYTTPAALPGDTSGSWRVGLEARRVVTLIDDEPIPGEEIDVNEAILNPVLDFSVDGSPVVPRREVVEDGQCATCHGVFSRGFGVHGNLRNQVEYCVVCHNPSVSDFARRRNAVASGAALVNEPINLKHMLHKIHRGEELSEKPYIIYGFGSGANGFTPHDFSEVLFPGDLRDCETCHVNDSYTLPLPAGLLPTQITAIDTGVMPFAEVLIDTIPPVTDACTSCHDGDAAMAHAETNTTAGGAEACTVCHGEGSSAAVSEVHALDP